VRDQSKSLTLQLSWRLIGLQILIVLGLIVALTYTLYNAAVTYVDEDVPRSVADALGRDAHGALMLHPDAALSRLSASTPNLWFAVADETGQRLTRGDVPAAYRPLLASLPELESSEIHANRAPYALTMRIYAADTALGRVHIMAGGAPLSGPGVLFLKLTAYLGWRMILPLGLLTLVVVPWLIRRAMAGVAEVAGQAQAINIDERGARLADRSVPRELQPLVRAFNAALERLNEGYDARDRFLVGAAHELRAPIAILEARLETLAPGTDRTRLLTDVARLANLAEQLLDLQRLGKHMASLEPLDLVALCREVTADVAPLVVGAGYELALDAPERTVSVIGDRLSLSRVLTNLIQNAMAHGQGRGLITVDVCVDGGFAVSDQGPGIPEQERQRVFEPFYRVRPSSKGTGLGLHLVQEIVTRHGGRIEVAEADGGGARFQVQLRLP
jgi:signal transduction histidine kinase